MLYVLHGIDFELMQISFYGLKQLAILLTIVGTIITLNDTKLTVDYYPNWFILGQYTNAQHIDFVECSSSSIIEEVFTILAMLIYTASALNSFFF